MQNASSLAQNGPAAVEPSSSTRYFERGPESLMFVAVYMTASGHKFRYAEYQ